MRETGTGQQVTPTPRQIYDDDDDIGLLCLSFHSGYSNKMGSFLLLKFRSSSVNKVIELEVQTHQLGEMELGGGVL
jgi:hypothetical protein